VPDQRKQPEISAAFFIEGQEEGGYEIPTMKMEQAVSKSGNQREVN